jgi:phospholipid transport system substrate-binding protein
VRICPYEVPVIDPETKKARIEAAACQGCGICVSECPVKAIVLQSTDFDTLSRLVLARNWSRFTPAQQAEFQREFESHLSATYGRRLDTYRNEKVSIVGDRKEANGDWTVQTRILRGGGSNDVVVDYRLRQTAGAWKVIDMIIEQVSLVANFRSQFQEIVGSGGPEKLLQVMRDKTAKGEEFKS